MAVCRRSCPSIAGRATWSPKRTRSYSRLRNGVSYTVSTPISGVAASSDIDVALAVLDSQLRSFIAETAPEHIFIHAGVVAYEGRAIVIPGPSFSGKTSLVAEFVRAGATYYSDEFAVLDAEGLVHPYAKPLSIRLNGFSQVDHAVESLGGSQGTDPLRIKTVLLCSYSPGAHWSPEVISGGDAVLAMLANTVPAQERPAQSLSAVKKALEGAVVVEGERGDAAEVVEDILEGVRA